MQDLSNCLDLSFLKSLSKKELIKRCFSLAEELIKSKEDCAAAESRSEELEKRLNAYENHNTPSSKRLKKSKSKTPQERKARFPGKPKKSNGGGIIMPPVDEEKTLPLDSCPCCGNTDLGKPIGHAIKKQVDLPEKPITCTEYTVLKYRCKKCKVIVGPKVNGIYGPRIKASVVLLKEEGLSLEAIARYLRALGLTSISAATLLTIIKFFIKELEPERKRIEDAVRNSPAVYADETEFRRDGQKGYVWVFLTLMNALFVASLSRGKSVPNELLGAYKGLIITDGHAGYNDFLKRQRCWAHLLRKSRDLVEKYGDELLVQHKRLKKIYERLSLYVDKPPTPKVRKDLADELEDIRVCLSAIKGGKKLAKYIENGGSDWFSALDYPGVEFHNNTAERGARKIVLQRNRMLCYRNEVGAGWINVCLSVIQTWKLQKKNVYENLVRIASKN